jgi:hypothetical protein
VIEKKLEGLKSSPRLYLRVRGERWTRSLFILGRHGRRETLSEGKGYESVLKKGSWFGWERRGEIGKAVRFLSFFFWFCFGKEMEGDSGWTGEML